jgi:serine/alanine adding enzyme
MITIKPYNEEHKTLWDNYVMQHPKATLFHLIPWKNIIEKTYGHKTCYLIAIGKTEDKITIGRYAEPKPERPTVQVVGILPLVHLKHFFFGNSLISIPFFDMGGILADNEDIEKTLLKEAIRLGKKLKADNIELRHPRRLSWFDSNEVQQSTENAQSATRNVSFVTKSHKVRMLLDLPEFSESLMKSFKSKLRSQIKKPLKEGLYPKVGGIELLEDFYKVFSINMRDLGSPVHSKTLIRNVLEEFPDHAKIVMVYKSGQAVACSMVVGFKDTLENPWASALKGYSRLSPNMLLYWSMLEHACDNGYAYFDFGRSSPDEGTYKFKKQWGTKPAPLFWHYIFLKGNPGDLGNSERSKLNNAVQYWQKLPVLVTKVIGPRIRKHIGL